MHSDASWETSDRYIRIEVFYRASTSMYESIVGMIGYDSEQDLYRMWMFARSQSEPMYLSGNFVDGSLILVSEPATMAGGIEKMRYSYTPGLDGGFEIIGERWTLEGWARYCTAHLQSEVFAD